MFDSSLTRIELVRIEQVTEHKVVYHWQIGESFRRYFRGAAFFVRYDEPITKVPEAVLTIPAVAVMSTLVWFLGATLLVSVLDRKYAESLELVRTALKQMYPALPVQGELLIQKCVTAVAPCDEQETPRSTKCALLFTGGVDSVNSALRHQTSLPLLLSVLGADVRLYQANLWQEVNRDQAKWAQQLKLPREVIETDFHDFVREWAVDMQDRLLPPRGWWNECAHGVVLTGLTAPLVWQRQIETLFIAASFSAEYEHSNGSHPSIDNAIAWGNTSVVHDNFEQHRVEKIHDIVSWAAQTEATRELRICQLGHNGRNCCRCEKCCRTIAGIALCGGDPRNFGFAVDETCPDYIRRALESNRWMLTEDTTFRWRSIQKQRMLWPDKMNPEWRDFFCWFDQSDLDSFVIMHPVTDWEKFKRRLRKALPFRLYAGLRFAKRFLFGPRLDY